MHGSPAAKSAAGFTVQVVLAASAVAESEWTPEVAHEIEKALDAPTGSLKVAETLESTATPVAPFVGVVEETLGAESVPGQSFAEPGVPGRSWKSPSCCWCRSRPDIG